jgi:hypothetical protein
VAAFTGQPFEPKAVGKQQVVERAVQAAKEDTYVESISLI